MDGFLIRPELALSTRRVPLLTYRGWELYLGERDFCCVTGEIRIPFHPPLWRFWLADTQIVEVLVEGEDGRRLSDRFSTSDAFHSW